MQLHLSVRMHSAKWKRELLHSYLHAWIVRATSSHSHSRKIYSPSKGKHLFPPIKFARPYSRIHIRGPYSRSIFAVHIRGPYSRSKFAVQIRVFIFTVIFAHSHIHVRIHICSHICVISYAIHTDAYYQKHWKTIPLGP
jgi:hypothetical protein